MESILIENEVLKATILRKGAECGSLKLKSVDREYIWQANPAFWNRHAPILFPTVGKSNQGRIRWKQKEYSMPQHGFARDCQWEIVEVYTDLLTCVLDSATITPELYPFPFRLFSTYRLEQNTLIHELKVLNNGSEIAWYTLGTHPAFLLPNSNLNEYVLNFELDEDFSRILLKDGLISNQKQTLSSIRSIPLHSDSFMDDAWVFNGLQSKWVELIHIHSDFKLKVDYSDFPQLGIWTKSADAGFICIEPWQGIADLFDFNGDISQRTGAFAIEAGESRTWKYSVTIL